MRQQPFASPGEALEQIHSSPETVISRGAEFLQHYGVKGMKWGVRKERETSGDGTVGVDPVTATYIALFLASTVATIWDLRKRALDSGERFQKQNKDVPWKKKDDLAKAAPPADIDSLFNGVVKPINPGYPKPGTKMNCRRATFAYEMRRRGYDVKATPSHYATGQDYLGLKTATMGKDTKYESLWGQKQIASPKEIVNATPQKRSELIFSEISKQPDGARGELGVGWRFGGGHSMAWEVVRGQPVVFDTQTRTTYRNPQQFKKFADVLNDAAITRTDNVKLDEQFLRRWVVNND